MLIDISKIRVSDRIRKDFGNIEELAADIKENGLINPPVVTPELELIAGERRLRACKHLGMNAITVNVMTVRDYEHQLRLEISENENRKEFTFSERVEWAKRLEQVERLKAKERMGQGSQNSDNQRTDDVVAEQSGFGSRDTYRKAKFIADNATTEIIQQLDAGLISTHKAFIETKERLREAEERAKKAEEEKEKLKRQLRNAVPADQLEDAIYQAVERHQEETELLLKQKQKDQESTLRQRDAEWKEKLRKEKENDQFIITTLRTGLQKAKEELEALKVSNPIDFDEQSAELQQKKLQHEADLNVVQLRVHYKQFIEKAAVSPFLAGAIASANPGERQRFKELVELVEGIISQTKIALNGRKVVSDGD